ncbi:MAG: hypothetical protein H6727_05965 [Myxococcales bacterium]|nr:hypothetical protein [Myxococcales bacterium]
MTSSTEPVSFLRGLQTLFWGALLLCFVAGMIYIPLAWHAVIFQDHLHFVRKDHLAWEHTYLHLDRHPQQWLTVVAKRRYLREYMMSRYAHLLEKKMQQKGNNLWQLFKEKLHKEGMLLLKKSQQKLWEEGKKRLKQEEQRLRKKLNQAQKRP